MGRLVLVVPAAAAAAVALGAGSARALNPQPLPPTVLGVVRDACTGVPVAGASVSLVSPTTGETNRGPTQTGMLGVFLVPAVEPGRYDLAVTAAGYDPVAVSPDPIGTPDAANPGPVRMTVSPGPINLPAGEAVNETVVVSVALAPHTKGGHCTVNPGPQNLPALSVLVRNARTGLPLVRVAGTLRPTSRERDPGPANFAGLGVLEWASLAPGQYDLAVGAPGYWVPGPLGVTRDPGPTSFPDGGSVACEVALDVLLLPAV